MPNRTPWLDEPDTSSSVSRQHYIDAGRYRGLMWEVCAEHGPAVAAHEGGRFVPYLGDLSATSDDARDTI